MTEHRVCISTKAFYTIPYWCGLSMRNHFDGVGGCWGISSGMVAEQGRDYCRGCGFYKKNYRKLDMDEFLAVGAGMSCPKTEAIECGESKWRHDPKDPQRLP